MPKQIQNPVVGQLLSQVFNLQGRVEPALDEIVTPTVQVADLGRGSPSPIVRGVVHQCLQGGVAGELFTARLEVPGNVIARVRRVHLYSASAAFFVAKFTNAGGPQANTAVKEVTDGRLSNRDVPAASVLTYGTQVGGLPATTWRVRVPTEGVTFEPAHWIVGSGCANQFGFMEFQLQSANVQVLLCLELEEYTIA